MGERASPVGRRKAVIFEGWDAVVLARAQFAFTMSFHIVFPAFSIGLASYLAVLEAQWLWTGREVFINLFNYWLKIFAVAVGMGVVSGIVMSYQFGTNWAAFSDKTGPVIGPLMAYEVLTVVALLTAAVVAGLSAVVVANAVGEGPVIIAACVRRRRRGPLREQADR